MKTLHKTQKILTILFSILSLLISTYTQGCQLRSIWEPYPPYQYMDESGQIRGLDIELLKAVAAAAKCHVSFQHLPWKRGLALLSKGLIDVGSGASKTKKRSKYAYFSVPYRDEAMSIYIQREPNKPLQFTNLTQLANSSANIGIVIGYTYGNEFSKLRTAKAFKGRLSEVLSDSINIHKLAANRIDAILIEQFGGAQLIDQVAEVNARIQRHPLKIVTGEIHFLFSKKSVSKKQLGQFNQALQDIKESGQYQEILKRYLY